MMKKTLEMRNDYLRLVFPDLTHIIMSINKK